MAEKHQRRKTDVGLIILAVILVTALFILRSMGAVSSETFSLGSLISIVVIGGIRAYVLLRSDKSGDKK